MVKSILKSGHWVALKLFLFKCDELNTKKLYQKFIESLLNTHGLSEKYNVNDFNITKIWKLMVLDKF